MGTIHISLLTRNSSNFLKLEMIKSNRAQLLLLLIDFCNILKSFETNLKRSLFLRVLTTYAALICHWCYLYHYTLERSSLCKTKNRNPMIRRWLSHYRRGPNLHKACKHKNLLSMKFLPWKKKKKQDYQPNFNLLHIACYWHSVAVCLSWKSCFY